MQISHKPTRHGKILSIVFNDENEYEKFISVIKADLDYINDNYENGEELTKYIKELYEKLQNRYTVDPKYNDGKPSTFLFDNDWMRIHFDYFFNMIYFLQELIAENQNQNSIIEALTEIDQNHENEIKLAKIRNLAIEAYAKLLIEERDKIIFGFIKNIEINPQLSENDRKEIVKIKEKLKNEIKELEKFGSAVRQDEWGTL